ncbi:MAG: LD-carboxypeptidase [Acidobacteria bacterium]|nr:LD-carboxypeptidase [Acidobacteriota bacterium]
MKLLRKPPALQKGDTIGILAPASPVRREMLERGARELERIGYRVAFGKGVLERRGFFAGEHKQRAESFLALLENPRVQAVFCARGGYGSNYVVEILSSRPLLRRLQRQAPKIVMGYSDLTSLLLFLNQRLGWVTFQGPMAGIDFAAGKSAYDRAVLEQVLSGAHSGYSLESDARSLRPGVAEGRLLGGCLPMLTATLGTPQEIDTRGTILLIEDIDEKPFRVDRMLFQLRQAGKFRHVRGIVFGQMPGCGAAARGRAELRGVILEALRGLPVPIVFGVRFGHTTGKCLTLPMGTRARLSAGKKVRLTLLEPAVAPPSGTGKGKKH